MGVARPHLLRGRPRLPRPFLGGRPRLAGGSTFHLALRRTSIASISSVSFMDSSFVSIKASSVHKMQQLSFAEDTRANLSSYREGWRRVHQRQAAWGEDALSYWTLIGRYLVTI